MIRFIDVYKEYDNGTKALKGVSMRIDDGEFVFLVGPSGSGKSTIIKLITGEIATTEGRLMVNGYNMNNIRPGQVPYMRRTLGIIFQDFRLIEKKTVYENLSFAMRAIGTSTRELRRRIPYVLELVGLEKKADQYPGELSGGPREIPGQPVLQTSRRHRERTDHQRRDRRVLQQWRDDLTENTISARASTLSSPTASCPLPLCA